MEEGASNDKWGFPKIRGTILEVPIVGTIVFWGLYLGSRYFGRLPNGAQGLGLTCWFLVVDRNEGMVRTHCFLEGHRASVSRYMLGKSEA